MTAPYLMLHLVADSLLDCVTFNFRVRTDPGKSWNFTVQNSRPWKDLEKAWVLEKKVENPGKSWNY